MDDPVLLPYRPKDPFTGSVRGGILDGLNDVYGGGGLELFMSPEEIAGIDDLVMRRSPATVEDSEPRPLEARDNSHSVGAGDELSGQESHSNGVVEGEYTGPQNPLDKTGEDRGSVAGKIWNLPNSAIGLGYGGLGYLAGWPSKWLGLQENAPGVTIGNNSVQFTDNPFGGVGAITLGNVEVMNGKPTDPADRDGINQVGQHEGQHTYQGEQLGPFYLPSNILGGAAGLLIDGEWHGQHNWNEVGPQKSPPMPWSK